MLIVIQTALKGLQQIKISIFFFTWWKLKIYIKRYIKKDFKTFKYSFIKLAYFLYIKELFKKYFVTTLLQWIWYLLITFEKWVQFRNKMHSDIQTKKCMHNALNQSFMCSSNIFWQNEINDSKWFRYWDTFLLDIVLESKAVCFLCLWCKLPWHDTPLKRKTFSSFGSNRDWTVLLLKQPLFTYLSIG